MPCRVVACALHQRCTKKKRRKWVRRHRWCNVGPQGLKQVPALATKQPEQGQPGVPSPPPVPQAAVAVGEELLHPVAAIFRKPLEAVARHHVTALVQQLLLGHKVSQAQDGVDGRELCLSMFSGICSLGCAEQCGVSYRRSFTWCRGHPSPCWLALTLQLEQIASSALLSMTAAGLHKGGTGAVRRCRIRRRGRPSLSASPSRRLAS